MTISSNAHYLRQFLWYFHMDMRGSQTEIITAVDLAKQLITERITEEVTHYKLLKFRSSEGTHCPPAMN